MNKGKYVFSQLISFLNRSQFIDTVRKMKKIVPEYKSNNSMNESLDKEITEKR